jgi:WD40 repeat protein/serine/threonine protein kinase
MTAPTHCIRCGAPISAKALDGLCIDCVGRAVLLPVTPPCDMSDAEPVGGTDLEPDGRVGGYRLVRPVGEGGFGVVYLAEQLAPVKRQVALKIIKLGMDTRQVVARFEAERQALALMDHAGIAKVFDAGATETGRPYFVMEFVEGVPITHFADGQRLAIAKRLELFIKVCDAVQHAHQKGVIHRDLKPSNILVAAQGTPKIIDFGLVKATHAELTDQTLITQFQQLIGTPTYMSPEQVEWGAVDVDTRSDIYSLGVLLYELLTGWTPFDTRELLRGGMGQAARRIREQDPPRPSARLRSANPVELAEVAQKRQISPEKLPGQVRGDLDCIVMKALEKNRMRRYGSAEALAEDLGRWLRKEPIQARPINAAERIIKWMRRNPKVATLAILLNLVFAVGLAGILFVSARLASANHDKDRANVQLAKNLRDFEWQRIDELISKGKRGDALANLGKFLRQNPNDRAAAMRLVSMLSGCNFALPAGAPLRHDTSLDTLALSSDGRRVVIAANDGKARVWELEGGRLLATLVHPLKVTEVVFAADEDFVLTTSQDGSFRLWDWRTTTMKFEFPKAPDFRLPALPSRDRKLAALRETESALRVWDLLAQQPLGGRLEMPSPIYWATFSQDSESIAVASDDGSVAVWTVKTSQPIAARLKHPKYVTRLQFSPDGTTLATTWGGWMTFWDTRTWVKLREFEAYDSQILQIEFSPDGDRLISTAYDAPLKIWDPTTGRMVGQPINAERPFAFFCLSPDGKRLVTRSRSGVVRLWNASTGLALSEPFEHEGPVNDVRFDPKAQFIVTSSQDGTVQVWNVQTDSPTAPIIKTTDTYPSACFSSNGQLVIGTTGGKAEVFDLQSRRRVSQPMAHAGDGCRLSVSADGKKLATASWDGTGRVWDLQTGEPLTPPLMHSGRVNAIAFSPDGRQVATGSYDNTLRLWDAATGQPLVHPLVHQGEVMDVKFRPDSRALLTASTDGNARLWSADTGELLWPEPLHHKGLLWAAEFSPDGQRIVTASEDRSAVVWEAQSRRPVTRPLMHEAGVCAAHFSPNGKRVLTCSDDGTARVWDSDTGEPVSKPMRHSAKVKKAEFSPDGLLVFTGSTDGVARLWDALTGYPVSEPLRHQGEVTCIQFSPDGKYCLSIAASDALHIWEVVVPPVPVPQWFPGLVEAVAGKRVDEHGDARSVSRESFQDYRQRFSDSPGTDFYSRYANWFLHGRLKDPAPPFVP